MREPSSPSVFEMQSQPVNTPPEPRSDDNPVNALPLWIKVHLLISRIIFWIMVCLGAPSLIAFGVITKRELRTECVSICLCHRQIYRIARLTPHVAQLR